MIEGIGILPHADFPHLVPCFRLARELVKLGYDVTILGSDAQLLGKGHSEAWSALLPKFGLSGREKIHRCGPANFAEWLSVQMKEDGLDCLFIDAVWQGLSLACQKMLPPNVVIHHAGLPDFRTRDMPAWHFVHPNHAREAWAQAREAIERVERQGKGIRNLFMAEKNLTLTGKAAHAPFEHGCGEFAKLPALRAMSLFPGLEFPEERGRISCLGSMLPHPSDPDWTHITEEGDALRPLVVFAFGTTAFQKQADYEWLLQVARETATKFPHAEVIAVAPEGTGKPESEPNANLTVPSWIPLWELLSSREARKLIVSAPGVGTLREATASATPILAIPRRLDQLGAAARVEYFGLGAAIVSPTLPPPAEVLSRIDELLQDTECHARLDRFRSEVRQFDATQPLQRFMQSLPQPH